MNFSVGLDIVTISRFKKMATYKKEKLLKIFSENELLDAQNNQTGNNFLPAKLASRFAAKEAFYKSLNSFLLQCGKENETVSLLEICKNITIKKSKTGIPLILCNELFFKKKFAINLSDINISLSLTDEKNTAAACVIIHKN